MNKIFKLSVLLVARALENQELHGTETFNQRSIRKFFLQCGHIATDSKTRKYSPFLKTKLPCTTPEKSDSHPTKSVRKGEVDVGISISACSSICFLQFGHATFILILTPYSISVFSVLLLTSK